MNLSGINIYHFHDPWPQRRPEWTAFKDMPPTPFRGSYCPNTGGPCRMGCWTCDIVTSCKTRRSDASSIPLYPATMEQQITHHCHLVVNVDGHLRRTYNTYVPFKYISYQSLLKEFIIGFKSAYPPEFRGLKHRES